MLSLLFIQASCVSERLESCPEIITTNVYITVAVEKQLPDVTKVDKATLYLFDGSRGYIRQVEVSKDEILNQSPVPVTYETGDIPYVIVWGNIKDRTEISDFAPGTSMEQILLTLKEDSYGYSQQPDDLFWGMKRLSGAENEEVVISPKTGRINITVKGLPVNREGEIYYFTAISKYSSFNLMGTPLYGECKLKFDADFNKQHDLITPQTYNLIHYPVSATDDADALNLELFKKIPGANADIPVLSVNKDQTGNYLVPLPGKKMNILIYFNQNGSAEVTVKVTSWDEVYQGIEW